MSTFAPCATCRQTVNVEYDCPYCTTYEGGSRPPQSAPGRESASVVNQRGIYRIGLLLQGLLGMYVAVAVWSLLSLVRFLAALEGVEAGSTIEDLAEFARIENTQLVASRFQAAAFLLIGLIWFVWFSRSYMQLDGLGHTRSHKAWWAVFGWIIPIMNWFRPRQIAGELWAKAEIPSVDATTDSREPDSEAPWFMNVWWSFYVLANQITVGLAFFTPDSIDGFIVQTLVEIAAVTLMTIAVPFAVLVVRSINTRQHTLARSLDAASRDRASVGMNRTNN